MDQEASRSVQGHLDWRGREVRERERERETGRNERGRREWCVHCKDQAVASHRKEVELHVNIT